MCSSIALELSPIRMRFSNTLKASQIGEWKENYIAYDALKALIAKDKDVFRDRVGVELKKANDFFFVLEKKALAERDRVFEDMDGGAGKKANDDFQVQYEYQEDEREMPAHPWRLGVIEIKDGFCEIGPCDTGDEDSGTASSEDRDRPRLDPVLPDQFDKRKREKNIQELLHAVINIKRFRELNYTGLVKLARRYARTHPADDFADLLTKRIGESYFNRSKRIDGVYRAVKDLYRDVFSREERVVARTMRKPRETMVPYASGVLGGVSIALICLLDFGKQERDRELFLATVLLQYSAFLFGLCLVIFRRFNINYGFIFNFDAWTSQDSDRYLFVVSLLIFINTAGTWINVRSLHASPYWMLVVQALMLLATCRMYHHSSRVYFLSVMSKITLLPLSLVRFRHFYFADVGQSLTFCIKKMVFCGMVLDWKAESAVNSFFSTIRLLQCLRRYRDTGLLFPHVANAFKYALSIVVGVSGALYESRRSVDLLVYKTLLVAVSAVCSSVWDIFVDWGILRQEVVYPRMLYSGGVVFNLFCRFSWVLELFVEVSPFWQAFLEINRRFAWILFRIEFEHLNNSSDLRSRTAWIAPRELFYKKDYGSVRNETETETDA